MEITHFTLKNTQAQDVPICSNLQLTKEHTKRIFWYFFTIFPLRGNVVQSQSHLKTTLIKIVRAILFKQLKVLCSKNDTFRDKQF